jgi:hypothetical protein
MMQSAVHGSSNDEIEQAILSALQKEERSHELIPESRQSHTRVVADAAPAKPVSKV